MSVHTYVHTPVCLRVCVFVYKSEMTRAELRLSS